MVNATTVSGFTSAIANAQPGDCINVAAGTYTLASPLTISQSGTASNPITITGAGTGSTIINVNTQAISHTASYVVVRKIRFTNLGLQSYWFEGTNHHNVLDSVEVDHAQHAGIDLRGSSHDNVIKNSLIHDTGLLHPYWGEGIYVGGTSSPGCSSCADLHVVRNQILHNHFGPNIGSQSIEIASGADSTTARGNYIDGTGTQWIPSQGSATLVAVTASAFVFDSNTVRLGSPQAVTYYAPTGYASYGNIASNNTIDLQNVHNFTGWGPYAFALTAGTTSPSAVTIKCNNTVINGAFSNVPCTP
jgi:hypothetical protein